jgi:hypothetical protein
MLEPLEDYRRMLEALDFLLRAVGDLKDDNQDRWRTGSQAEVESATFPDAEAARTAYAPASLAITVAGDNMFAIGRALTEPVLTVAPWVLARAVLESASVAAWLLDPKIDARTRVSRSMSLRLKHLRDELTYVRSALDRRPVAKQALTVAIPTVENQINGLSMVAQKRGITLRQDSRGNLIGFPDAVPAFTVLADNLGEADTYRLLSGLAHGRSWAVMALATRSAGVVAGVPMIEQNLSANSALFIISAAAEWFSKPVWNYVLLNGWDLGRLTGVLEEAYDQLHMVDDTRFWR